MIYSYCTASLSEVVVFWFPSQATTKKLNLVKFEITVDIF